MDVPVVLQRLAPLEGQILNRLWLCASLRMNCYSKNVPPPLVAELAPDTRTNRSCFATLLSVLSSLSARPPLSLQR